MVNKKRINALASLAEDMNVQTSVRTNEKELIGVLKESEQKLKPKSRVVSNVPWYPKSEILKKELKLLAIHENSSLTALIDEGIKLVLEKRGKDINDYL